MLEEGGEFNAEGMWREESKRRASSQRTRKKKGKFLPSLHFYLSYGFFFFFCLRRKRCQRKNI